MKEKGCVFAYVCVDNERQIVCGLVSSNDNFFSH